MRGSRRLVVLLFAATSLASAFLGYTRAVGHLDGLPPLPPAFAVEMLADAPERAPTVSATDQRLALAWGPNCLETNYPIKIDVRDQGTLLAARGFEILEDGRVRFTEVSVALFGKGKPPEINTIHCDAAKLTFDQPVKTIAEMGGRKLLAAELLSEPGTESFDSRNGMIYLGNNRKTAAPEDDILLRTPGPIHYRDLEAAGVTDPKQPHVWADSTVELVDRQNGPRPATPRTLRLPATLKDDLRRPNTLPEIMAGQRAPLPTINAVGMKLYLAASKPAAASAKGPVGGSQLKRIEMNTNVSMNLWVDGSSDFLSGGADKPAAPEPRAGDAGAKPPAEAKDRVLVQIETYGPFEYDVEREVAHFQISTQTDPHLHNNVFVKRHVKPGFTDMLVCDDLVVHFQRGAAEVKPAPTSPPVSAPPAAPASSALQIRRVEAVGKSVAVSSDTDPLEAWGSKLVYDAATRTTTLTGDRMIAVKDGNLIEAYELILTNLNDKKTQSARARGPGRIGMGTLDPKTQSHARQAVWQDWLTFSKDKQDGRDLDLVTLTGGARFLDKAAGQSLDAKTLRVWLIPAGAKSARPSGGPKPTRLEADVDVVLHSADLIIERADYLNTRFRDLPEFVGPPAPPPPAPPSAPAVAVAPPAAAPTPTPPPVVDAPPAPPKSPARLTARRVETWVVRDGQKSQLERAVCEGDVAVHQDATAKGQRGTDLAGRRMTVDHFPEGDLLKLWGTPDQYASVQAEQISIAGAEVHLDQRDDRASVAGSGRMRLLSATGLDGKKLDKAAPVDILFADGMDFRGGEKWARFDGNVQATQASAGVLCQNMQVTLDREVFLHPERRKKAETDAQARAARAAAAGEPKPEANPKVDSVVCDQQPRDPARQRLDLLQPVTYTDATREKDVLTRYQSVAARELNLDNLTNTMTAPGPGVVRIFQAGKDEGPLPGTGSGTGGAPRPRPATGAKAEPVFKLTWVSYKGRMAADNRNRTAKFFDGIDVMHFPAGSPTVPVDIASLPPEGVYLKTDDSLDVVSRKQADGTTSTEMVARGNCLVKTAEMYARSDVVKYDESKDTLIFEGHRTPAQLFRNRDGVRGSAPERVTGTKIVYYLKSKTFDVEGGTGVTGSTR